MTAIRSESGERVADFVGEPAVVKRNKIYELAALGATIARLKAEGKRVALCHGVFDLLHVGHIRHLAEARACADVLVVTVTEDVHVNKGPHRPAFGEALRCEALAALDAVDFVAINRGPLAVNAIEALAPDVYVKGPDYASATDDVSGGIIKEEVAVKAAGGKVHYTRGDTFSSSHLLNRNIATFEPAVEKWLEEFRSRHSVRDVIDAVKALAALRVVVVGEAILDEYVFCDQMGKSAKEPVLAMRYHSRELQAGGALAIANHLGSFCRSVELITYLGDRNGHEDFVRSHLLPNVRASIIYKRDSPTIVKRRYVERYLSSKLFEMYEINDELLEPDQDAQFCELVSARVANTDAVVVADFGHGLLTPAAVDVLTGGPQFLAVNTQINAANIGFHTISKYANADYVCVHEGEIRLDARNRRGPLTELIASLRTRTQCENILVTQGKNGCVFFAGDRCVSSPAFAGTVVDRIGSGDAVLAITSALVATGIDPEITAFVANVVGAQKVAVMGNRSAIDRVASIKFIESLLK